MAERAVRLRAAFGRLPLVRSILAHPTAARIVAVVQIGALVRPSWSFVGRELRDTRMVRRYRLRGTDVHIALEHGTPDVFTLAEIYYERIYEPPAQVRDRLGDAPAEVLDLGANIGLFSVWARRRWPGAAILAVEPDPRNAALLRGNVASLGGTRVLEVAAGTADGTVRFAAGGFSASHVGAGDLEVPARDCFAWLRACDLAKIDIEGTEWELLGDPRFAHEGPDVMAIEYHPHNCPEPPARACAERLLTAAGFAHCSVFHDADLGVGMLWAWRPSG